MRRSLGLSDGSRPPVADDSQRLARQAIRLQAAAREYAERQLARAEQTIQDLRTKFHGDRRERNAAVVAARTAQAAQAQAERSLRTVEAALTHEKAMSGRAQREAQEARATVHDLRTKPALANPTVETLQAQLAQERQARIAVGQSQMVPQALVAVGEIVDAPSEQPVKRKRGRQPGKRNASVPRQPALKTRKTYAANQKPVQ